MSRNTKERRVREFHPDRVKPMKGQPRKLFRNIEKLAESIKEAGQHTPGMVVAIDGSARYDAELIDGERRLRACKIAGVPFRAEVREERPMSERFMLSLGANFGREDHTSTEIAVALDRATKGGWTEERLSRALGKSVTWVHQHLSLLRLDPKVFAMLEKSEQEETRQPLNFSTALNLVNLPKDEQRLLARRIAKGDFRSIEELRRHILSVGEKKGIAVRQKTRSSDQLFSDFEKLVDKTTHRVGVFIDMRAEVLNGMIESASPEEIAGMLKMLEALIVDMKGLAETIEHRALRQRNTRTQQLGH